MKIYHLKHSESNTLFIKFEDLSIGELDINLILTIFYDFIYKKDRDAKYVCVLTFTPFDEKYNPLYFPTYVDSSNQQLVESKLLEFLDILVEDSSIKIYKVSFNYKLKY
jgi:hypothetical protein